MPQAAGQLSENSRRLARNTLLLYFRMFLLMLIGLLTSRVVLRTLGIDDYGIYNVVGGVVTVFTFLTTSISAAISRYLAVGLGEGDPVRLRRIFSTGMLIQLALSLLLVLLVETAGVWWLNHRLNIPAGRLDAARWVLQCSLGIMIVGLLAVPYNAAIIAHERMSAFALISLGEAALKLGVALLLYLSPADKLVSYAVLMLCVAVLVRLAYGLYCHRHFAESRGRLVWDGSLMREMTAFAGWSFFGSSAYVFNTQGVNQVVNLFFGVAVNAARGVALQVENIVKQFVSNFLTALNPQITKSWAAGEREHCFELVRKGAKYSWLVILVFFIPVLGEAEWLLGAWLGPDKVPPYAAIFLRLTLVGLLVDLAGNSLLTLIQASGHVKRYYLVTGLTSYLGLPLVWLAFKLGAGPAWAYVIFIAVYLVVFVERVILAHRLVDFPVRPYLQLVLLLVMTTCFALVFPILLRGLEWAPVWRLLTGTLLGWAVVADYSWFYLLTDGEKDFVVRKLNRFLPDAVYLRYMYRKIFGRKLHLKNPQLLSEKVQWLKLHDRRQEYTAFSDKAGVKDIVADRIGDGFIVPTLAVWDSASKIDFDALPDRFVLKCTHDSGSVIVCRDRQTFDFEAARRSLDQAMHRNFYLSTREWAYKDIKPQIIAEPYLDDGNPDGLTDYKFFCFGGEPRFLYVSRGLEDHATARMGFAWPDWTPAPFRRSDFIPFEELPPCPEGLGTMLEACRKLSAGIPYVRVDFYQVGSSVLFSEMTFYPCGGFMPFENEEQDLAAGKMLELPGRKLE